MKKIILEKNPIRIFSYIFSSLLQSYENPVNMLHSDWVFAYYDPKELENQIAIFQRVAIRWALLSLCNNLLQLL